MSQPTFDRIVAAFGSQRLMAAALGVTAQSVTKWRKQVPAERVLEIERLTGISRHEIRPDVFGHEPTPIAREGIHTPPIDVTAS